MVRWSGLQRERLQFNSHKLILIPSLTSFYCIPIILDSAAAAYKTPRTAALASRCHYVNALTELCSGLNHAVAACAVTDLLTTPTASCVPPALPSSALLMLLLNWLAVHIGWEQCQGTIDTFCKVVGFLGWLSLKPVSCQFILTGRKWPDLGVVTYFMVFIAHVRSFLE